MTSCPRVRTQPENFAVRDASLLGTTPPATGSPRKEGANSVEEDHEGLIGREPDEDRFGAVEATRGEQHNDEQDVVRDANQPESIDHLIVASTLEETRHKPLQACSPTDARSEETEEKAPAVVPKLPHGCPGAQGGRREAVDHPVRALVPGKLARRHSLGNDDCDGGSEATYGQHGGDVARDYDERHLASTGRA